MKHTQRNINPITYKNMHDTISKYVLSLGLFVLLAGDCNPTPDPIAGQALFKKLAFTVDKVNYDFDFEAEPTPGTLAINNSTPTNLANAQQTASGATLVADGKTYGIAYKNINDTVYLTLTLPDDVESLPTSIILNTLSVSEKSTLVDQNGASITEGQSLSRRNDAFITKIISEDGKKNTIYNIQLKLNENTPQTPTITKLALISSLENGEDLSVDLTAMTVMVPAGVSISTKVFIKELVTSSNDVQVFDKDGNALGENSEIVIEDHTVTLKVGFSADKLDKTYTLQITSPAPAGAVLSSLTLSYLDLQAENIELVGKSSIIALEMGQRMPSEVTINSYQLADDSKEATVSLSGGSALSISTPTKVTLENNAFKLYVTPVGGGEATEYTITFREALHTGSTLMSLTLTGSGIKEVITFTDNQIKKTIILQSEITLPLEVKVSELVVSEGTTVTVGGEMIQIGQEKEITFNGSPIIFKVTSQSGISTDYMIVFDLQNILKSLVLDVEGEAVELQVSTGNTNEWIGEIGFDNTFTGSSTVLVTSLSLSDKNRARIIPTTGEPVEVEKDKTFSLNEYRATLEVYVEGDEDDKQVYTLSLQRNSIMMKSYSQEMLGTEVPPIGIALLDSLKTADGSLYDYEVLRVTGLQKQETDYKLRIMIADDEFQDKDIKSTADGELILMKRDFMPFMPATETDPAILTKDVETADITLLTAGAGGTEIAIIGKYDKSKIRDWKDLQGMRMDLGASYTLVNDIALPTPGEEGLPQKGFEPIGTLIVNTNGSINDKSTPFTGKLNGVDNGLDPNKIMDLSIDRSSEDGVGLFAYVKDAEIRNLMIESLTIKGRNYVGALAGAATGSTKIEDVGVTGGDVNGNNDVGGLVGYNRGSGTITSCYATGDVTASNSGSNSYVGGLVGRNRGTITSCYATGDVTGERDRVGGLVGHNSNTITSCYATGAVTGTRTDDVGGLVGYNGFKITSCYATGAVEGSNNVGGLVGYNFGTITSCYATGDVSGGINVGGLVGVVDFGSPITSCYATGDVNGRDQVGGLVGDHSSNTTTTSCYYDKETTGQDDRGVGSGAVTGVMGLKKSEIMPTSVNIYNPFMLDKPDTEAVEGFNFEGDDAVWVYKQNEWPKLTWETN